MITQTREFVDTLTIQIQTRAMGAGQFKLVRVLGLNDQLSWRINVLTVCATRRARVHGLG